MDPALHVLSPRAADERLELWPTGRTMARVLAFLLLLVGASLVLVWLVSPHAERASEVAVGVIVVVAWALGGVLLSGWVDDRGARPFEVVVAAGTVMISVAVLVAQSPASGFAFFYLWLVPVAYAFFSLRRAVLQTALMAVGLAAALLLQPVVDSDLPFVWGVVFVRWLLCVATAVVMGAVIRRIVTARQVSLARLARGFADASVGMAVVGADARWIEVNAALCRLLGRSRDELVGHSPSEVAHPEDVERIRALVDRVPPEGGRTQTPTQRYVRADGEVVWASVDSLRFERKRGEPFFFFSSTTSRLSSARTTASVDRRARTPPSHDSGAWRSTSRISTR